MPKERHLRQRLRDSSSDESDNTSSIEGSPVPVAKPRHPQRRDKERKHRHRSRSRERERRHHSPSYERRRRRSRSRDRERAERERQKRRRSRSRSRSRSPSGRKERRSHRSEQHSKPNLPLLLSPSHQKMLRTSLAAVKEIQVPQKQRNQWIKIRR